MFSDVDPVLVLLHESLLVDHHSLRKGLHLTPGIIRALGLLMRKHTPIFVSAAWTFGAWRDDVALIRAITDLSSSGVASTTSSLLSIAQ
jgi:hypothetical protein